ncbi:MULTISPECIES: hypothetical protein [unclassified Allomuricauda]|uniref:hypothetical protein n=1 Tax=unclassified Allomuricauda TaxID=2615049 RepID=UPI00273FECDA|nr:MULTISPECIES: hypothetical protein [unclassified Allomuricauda]
MEGRLYKEISQVYSVGSTGKKLKVWAILFLFILSQSCGNYEVRELDVFLWSLTENNPYPKATEILIENGKLYKSDFGELLFRELKKSEKDSLNSLASKMDMDKVDSTYYNHLARYYYMFDLSMDDGDAGFSTSVYDSVVPKEIKEVYDYLVSISEKDEFEEVKGSFSELNDFYLHRLVNPNGDTILPSRETFFKINKTLLDTPKEDWIENSSPMEPNYQILVGHPSSTEQNVELLGITKNDTLFFKVKEKYFSTKFQYRIEYFPEYNPSILR